MDNEHDKMLLEILIDSSSIFTQYLQNNAHMYQSHMGLYNEILTKRYLGNIWLHITSRSDYSECLLSRKFAIKRDGQEWNLLSCNRRCYLSLPDRALGMHPSRLICYYLAWRDAGKLLSHVFILVIINADNIITFTIIKKINLIRNRLMDVTNKNLYCSRRHLNIILFLEYNCYMNIRQNNYSFQFKSTFSLHFIYFKST